MKLLPSNMAAAAGLDTFLFLGEGESTPLGSAGCRVARCNCKYQSEKSFIFLHGQINQGSYSDVTTGTGIKAFSTRDPLTLSCGEVKGRQSDAPRLGLRMFQHVFGKGKKKALSPFVSFSFISKMYVQCFFFLKVLKMSYLSWHKVFQFNKYFNSFDNKKN